MMCFTRFHWEKAMAMLLLVLGLTACSSSDPDVIEKPEPEIIIPEESQEFFANGVELSPEGGSQDIYFTATDDWTATAEDTKGSSWLTVSPSSGKSGKVKLTLSAQKANGAQSAVVTISSGKVFKKLPVTQPAKKANQGIKAAYADFLGTWIVTGTEHKWFMDEGQKPATYSYEIQIIENEKNKSYLIQNWETGATPEDAAHLYYGSTVKQSLYSYFTTVTRINVNVVAWYDADKGQLHIDRQTFYHLTGQNKTVEFLGDVVDPDGHTSIGSFNSTDGDTVKDYTICDFLLQENGSVNICASDLLPAQWMNMAFMGYARYDGFLWSMHYNKKFAFPYSMVKK